VSAAQFDTNFQNVFKDTTALSLNTTGDLITITSVTDALATKIRLATTTSNVVVSYSVTYLNPNPNSVPTLSSILSAVNSSSSGTDFKAALIAYATLTGNTTLSGIVTTLTLTVTGTQVVVTSGGPTSTSSTNVSTSPAAGFNYLILLVILVLVPIIGYFVYRQYFLQSPKGDEKIDANSQFVLADNRDPVERASQSSQFELPENADKRSSRKATANQKDLVYL
jgi:hypothetical protein